MLRKYQTSLLASVSLVGLALAQPSYAAQQTASQAAQSEFDEIVVTARRVEEDIQEVPMSVKAYTTDSLTKLNVANVFSVGKLVPGIASAGYGENATVVGAGATGKSAIYSRGIQGVPIYLNEVPISPHINGAFFDLANLQVLKGPQGTLFGIATNGGAMLFETQKPVNRIEGYAKVGVGTRLAVNKTAVGRDFEAVVNVPIIDDTLLMRAGATTSVRPGYVFDLAQSKWMNDRNYWDGRFQLTYQSGAFRNEFFINYYAADTNGSAVYPKYFDLNPAKSFVRLYGQRAIDYAYKQQTLDAYTAQEVTAVPGGTFSNVRGVDIINKTFFDISDNIQLKNIFGYGRARSYGTTTGSSTFLGNNKVVLANGTTPPLTVPGWQVSIVEEIQLNGALFDGMATWVVGNFNRWEKTTGPFKPSWSAGTLSVVTASLGAKNPARSNGLYAQTTIDLGSFIQGLKFTGGYRRTWDARKVVATSLNPNTLAINTRVAVSTKNVTPSYTLSLSYQPIDDVTLFVTNSEAFSVAGANTGVGLPEQYRRVKPESLNNIEYGIKSQFDIGVPVRVNITGYVGDYKDAQQFTTTTLVSTITNLPSTFGFTQNTDKVKLWGWEGEFSIRPTEDLTVSVAGALQRYDFIKWINAGGVDITELYETLPLVPRTSYNINLDYRLPFVPEEQGDLTLTLAYRYQGNLYNFSVRPADVRDGSPHWNQIDVTATWDRFLGYDNVDATLQVINVNRNKRLGAMIGLYTSFGIGNEAPAEPLSWFMSFKYKF